MEKYGFIVKYVCNHNTRVSTQTHICILPSVFTYTSRRLHEIMFTHISLYTFYIFLVIHTHVCLQVLRRPTSRAAAAAAARRLGRSLTPCQTFPTWCWENSSSTGVYQAGASPAKPLLNFYFLLGQQTGKSRVSAASCTNISCISLLFLYSSAPPLTEKEVEVSVRAIWSLFIPLRCDWTPLQRCSGCQSANLLTFFCLFSCLFCDLPTTQQLIAASESFQQPVHFRGCEFKHPSRDVYPWQQILFTLSNKAARCFVPLTAEHLSRVTTCFISREGKKKRKVSSQLDCGESEWFPVEKRKH